MLYTFSMLCWSFELVQLDELKLAWYRVSLGPTEYLNFSLVGLEKQKSGRE